ncbi:2-polyprenyl-6-methoxyphenol hydroxylase [Actinopolymorpha cephalotaxi]|uniref:2-polyprenyl-6-methoxyphenol hydroxylase n=1 Tax=Actinopolymorpha cephalotaxi TaxID=504797 RepID=A0A1I2UP69_9ACTN|nr:FAD-dependent monooxygenase [Actinopolymorpha cephalotaxi]NYH86678.1 2-polyprenyl-6-methoxyphenol hydroxylase-like FAD-dependent oxidoreductase [Actinopolymorpha cephalotaxi]SFG78932.1 2-polyprenyl-6-methoxyphenol hydroxylase [Actinopolymorpha cephalotaxi]
MTASNAASPVTSAVSTDEPARTSVLVVGGSLTGLSTAVFLAWHGVPVVVAERHPDLLMHPRLRGLSPRTVELYRQVGMEEAILAASYARAEAFEWIPVRAETLADEEYSPVEGEGDPSPEAASPCGQGPIDQDQLELLLRARARELGADVRFATEVTEFGQDADGVTATLRDLTSGAVTVLRADYLVGADGWISPVRTALGIEVDGPGALFHTITAIVEADLTPATRGREVTIAYLQQPQPFTILMAHDDLGQRWVFGTGYSPEHEGPEDFTDERVVAMVRAAAGLPDVKVTLLPQIPGTERRVFGFGIGAQLARRYGSGRVFLVGDAAHLMPPTGGLNGNTGVQDAHNLAWKLAAVLHGQAGPALLDTYHDERHPTGHLTTGQAYARFGNRMGPDADVEMLEYSAVAMGYQYRSAAVVGAGEGASPLPPDALAGQPGTRAPHVVAGRGGAEISTLDLYGREFVLLAGPAGQAWTDAAEAVQAELGVRVTAYRFGADLTAAGGPERHGIGADGAVLVRPDGVVAWRSVAAPADGDGRAELDQMLRAVLARG